MVTADRGTNFDRESVRVRPQSDPPSSGECNVCEDNTTKGKTQKIKDESAADLCGIDDIDGHAKSD